MRHREMRATTDKRQRHSRQKGAGCERVNDVRVWPARGDGQGAQAARRARRGPVVDERANGDRAVAGGVVVANEGRRGRRAKLMDDERPRTPADDHGGSAEGGWCRLSIWKKIMGWCAQAGKSGTMCKNATAPSKNATAKKDRSSKVRSSQVRSPSEIERAKLPQRTKKQSVSRRVIWYAR